MFKPLRRLSIGLYRHLTLKTRLRQACIEIFVYYTLLACRFLDHCDTKTWRKLVTNITAVTGNNGNTDNKGKW